KKSSPCVCSRSAGKPSVAARTLCPGNEGALPEYRKAADLSSRHCSSSSLAWSSSCVVCAEVRFRADVWRIAAKFGEIAGAVKAGGLSALLTRKANERMLCPSLLLNFNVNVRTEPP